MRQKYVIERDPKKKTLSIKEYAVIEKNLNNTDSSMLRPEDYAFLHQEIYNGPLIKRTISSGKRSVVAALRTPTFFPNERCASKIAESVMELLDSQGDRSAEVFIDDLRKKEAQTDDDELIAD